MNHSDSHITSSMDDYWFHSPQNSFSHALPPPNHRGDLAYRKDHHADKDHLLLQAWQQIEQIKVDDLNLHLTVYGYNRGGLLVKWDILHGFVPSSQLVDFPTNIPESQKAILLQNKVGQVLKLRVLEIVPEQKRLVLSERAAKIESGERFTRLSHLQTGQEIVGTITNLTDFGAFVDIGGIEGLVHISEISWGRVNHPSQFLKLYQSTHACVLQVEPEQGKLALSIKRLRPDPWQTVNAHYQAGQVIMVTISAFAKFGIFVRIADGLEGLIHCSEVDEAIMESLHIGHAYPARILNIEPNTRRFGLSFKNI